MLQSLFVLRVAVDPSLFGPPQIPALYSSPVGFEATICGINNRLLASGERATLTIDLLLLLCSFGESFAVRPLRIVLRCYGRKDTENLFQRVGTCNLMWEHGYGSGPRRRNPSGDS